MRRWIKIDCLKIIFFIKIIHVLQVANHEYVIRLLSTIFHIEKYTGTCYGAYELYKTFEI